MSGVSGVSRFLTRLKKLLLFRFFKKRVPHSVSLGIVIERQFLYSFKFFDSLPD